MSLGEFSRLCPLYREECCKHETCGFRTDGDYGCAIVEARHQALLNHESLEELHGKIEGLEATLAEVMALLRRRK